MNMKYVLYYEPEDTAVELIRYFGLKEAWRLSRKEAAGAFPKYWTKVANILEEVQ